MRYRISKYNSNDNSRNAEKNVRQGVRRKQVYSRSRRILQNLRRAEVRLRNNNMSGNKIKAKTTISQYQ